MREGKAADVRLKDSEKKLEQVTEQFHKLGGEVEKVEKNIEEVSKMHTDARCPTCFSGITEDSKQSAVGFLIAHHKHLKSSYTLLQTEYETTKKEVEENKKQLEILKDRLQEFSRWAKEKLHLQDTIKLFKEAYTEAKLTIENHKSTIKENTSTIEQYSKEVEQLEGSIKEIVFDSSGFESLNKEISKYSSTLSDCLRLIADNQVLKGRALAEVQNTKDSIEKVRSLKIERDFSLKEKFYYTELVKMFGKDIPTLIIENACLELSSEANKILNSISEDTLEFVTQRENQDGSKREVFEIEITRPGISHPILIDSLSNGQKFRVVFAIRIALSRLLVRRRNSSSMEFLFYDECFSSLDDEGIEDVINVFRYLKDEFSHQLIITHGTNLKDRFDNNIILVNQKQGCSSIKYNGEGM
jgi:exonuclease SbcC